MYLKESSLYVSGLTKMASSCSSWIGLSYMDAVCFEKKTFKEDFCSLYGVSNFELEASSLTLSQLFTSVFGDNSKLVEGLCHWLKLEAGGFITVYNCDDKLCSLLSDSKAGRTLFYMVEDVCFVEFEKMMICFIIGNDE